jgi:multiple sugar transport system ATP-binding protein
MADVALNNVVKRFDRDEAVRGISLNIPDKEFIVLVGPSGCGKTTTLRMIAGLEEATAGEILIDGQVVNDVPPKDRDIAMVFQNYALYPHMTVFENMSFGLKLRRVPKTEIKERVERAAKILDIADLLERRPKQLSGGQRQRVAMGRAIVRNPKVFLFDEPLSNLDAKLRVQTRTEIKRVHQQVKTTTIYVTHDQVEAMTLADRVVVMNGGRIEQTGRPQELYHQPRTRFVAGFIGSPAMNFLTCRLERNGSGLMLRLGEGLALPVPASRAARYQAVSGKELIFGLRPEHITEPRGEARDPRCEFTVNLDVVEPMGMETMVFFGVNGTEICARVTPDAAAAPGQPMRLYANLNHLHLIDPATDLVLCWPFRASTANPGGDFLSRKSRHSRSMSGTSTGPRHRHTSDRSSNGARCRTTCRHRTVRQQPPPQLPPPPPRQHPGQQHPGRQHRGRQHRG